MLEAMRFHLIDRVLERGEGRLVAIKQVTAAEEYLADHFPSFPILPGVLMLESLVQASRSLLRDDGAPWVLGSVRALKYGAIVRPGMTMRITVEVASREDETVTLKGSADLIDPVSGERLGAAAGGRITMRRLRVVGVEGGDLSTVGSGDSSN